MLRLNTDDSPVWLDLLPGVRIRHRPVKTLDVLVSQAAAGKVFEADREAETKDPDVGIAASIALTASIAHRVITEWTGIGDEEGEPAPVTPEAIDAALLVVPFYDAFDRKVVTPALKAPAE